MPVNINNIQKATKRKILIGTLVTLGGLGTVGLTKAMQQPLVHADTNAPVTSTMSQNESTTDTVTSNSNNTIEPNQESNSVQPQSISTVNNNVGNNASVAYSGNINTTDNTGAYGYGYNTPVNVLNSNTVSSPNEDLSTELTSNSGTDTNTNINSATSISSEPSLSNNGVPVQHSNNTLNGITSDKNSLFNQKSNKLSAPRMPKLPVSLDTDIHSNIASNITSYNVMNAHIGSKNLQAQTTAIPYLGKNDKKQAKLLTSRATQGVLHSEVLPVISSPRTAPKQPRVTPHITVSKVVPLKLGGQLNTKQRPKMMLLGSTASGLPSKVFINDISDYTEGTDYADAGGGPYPQIDLSTWGSPKGTIAFCNDYSLDGPHGGREYVSREGSAPIAMRQALAYAIDSANIGRNGINHSNLRLVEELIIWETETANPRQRIHPEHVHGEPARSAAFLAKKAIDADYPYFGDVAPKVSFIPEKSQDSPHILKYRIELKNGTNVNGAHIYMKGAPKGSTLYVHAILKSSGTPISFVPDDPNNLKAGYHAMVSVHNLKDNLETDKNIDKMHLTVKGNTDGKIQVQDYKTSGGGSYLQDVTLMKVTPHAFDTSAGAKGGGTPSTTGTTGTTGTTPTTPGTKSTPGSSSSQKTTNNNNNNNSSSGGGGSSSSGGGSSSSTGGSPSGNGNQQQGGNGNGTNGGGNGTQGNGNGNNGGGNGSPSNNPNNGNNGNNGQPNNSNPNNDNPNNVIVPSTDGGHTSNNNNIVPNGPVINNNDYILPNGLNGNSDDNKDAAEIIAALVNNEDRDNQDALNRLDSDVQHREAETIQSAKANAINSANILSAAERGKNAAQIEAMNASASVQSIEDSMAIDSEMTSLSDQANNAKTNYMDSLGSLEAESNKLATNALANLRNIPGITNSERRQAYINIQRIENNFIKSSTNGNSVSDGAIVTLRAQLNHIQAELHNDAVQASNSAANYSANASAAKDKSMMNSDQGVLNSEARESGDEKSNITSDNALNPIKNNSALQYYINNNLYGNNMISTSYVPNELLNYDSETAVLPKGHKKKYYSRLNNYSHRFARTGLKLMHTHDDVSNSDAFFSGHPENTQDTVNDEPKSKSFNSLSPKDTNSNDIRGSKSNIRSMRGYISNSEQLKELKLKSLSLSHLNNKSVNSQNSFINVKPDYVAHDNNRHYLNTSKNMSQTNLLKSHSPLVQSVLNHSVRAQTGSNISELKSMSNNYHIHGGYVEKHSTDQPNNLPKTGDKSLAAFGSVLTSLGLLGLVDIDIDNKHKYD